MPTPPMFIEVTRTEIKSTKPYNFLRFYIALHEWVFDENYTDGGDFDAKFPEKYYWESRSQTEGNEYWIWWRCKKMVPPGNKLFKRVIDLDIHGVGVKQEEIMYGGKRIKVNKGKFELIIRGKIEIDPGGKWRNSNLSFLFDVFWKRIWRKELEMYRREVNEDVLKLHDFARDFMGLPTVKRRPHLYPLRYGYEEDH